MTGKHRAQHARAHGRAIYTVLLVVGVGVTSAGGIELGEHLAHGNLASTSSAAALVGKSPEATAPQPPPVPTISADAGSVSSGTPVRISIPEIGVDAVIQTLSLNVTGALSVPTQSNQAGWYTGSAVPGLPGPTVIVGHLDTTSGPAVFYGLPQLEVGDEISVRLSSGQSVVYVVTGTQIVAKTAFPTTEVYGPTPDSELRLVTCTGDLVDGSYLDNLIVFATEKS
jgi:sortase (surface protein transpeptidase)